MNFEIQGQLQGSRKEIESQESEGFHHVCCRHDDNRSQHPSWKKDPILVV